MTLKTFSRLEEKQWWLVPLALFVLTQLILLLMLATGKSSQEAIPKFDGYQYFVDAHKADPPWDQFASQWNGFGFKEVATNGYPKEIPYFKDNAGPAPSPWAFFPLFPLLCSILMLTGMSFGYAAIAISLTSALGGCLILYRWIRSHTKSPWAGALAVGTILLFPAAGLFQLAYAEALAFFLLVSILLLISKKKYLWSIPLVLLLGLTRPVGIPDFLVFSIHGVFLSREYLKSKSLTFGDCLKKPRELITKTWAYGALLFASAFSAIIWPLIGIFYTGENSYFAARSGYYPDQMFSWFTTNPFRSTEAYPLGTGVFLFGYLAWGLLIIFSKSLKSYPSVLRIWPLVFTIYIFTMTSPAGNELRYLLLGFFIFPWIKIPEIQWRRIAYFGVIFALVIVALHAQYTWINVHWISTAGELRKNV